MARRTAQPLQITPQAARRTPLDIMCQVAEFFLVKAEEYDTKVAAAIKADAQRADIMALMDIAAQHRIRAATVAEKAAPYVSPRLQAVEISPVSEPTKSRFDQRLEAMSEEEVVEYLRRVGARTATVALLEDDREAEISPQGVTSPETADADA